MIWIQCTQVHLKKLEYCEKLFSLLYLLGTTWIIMGKFDIFVTKCKLVFNRALTAIMGRDLTVVDRLDSLTPSTWRGGHRESLLDSGYSQCSDSGLQPLNTHHLGSAAVWLPPRHTEAVICAKGEVLSAQMNMSFSERCIINLFYCSYVCLQCFKTPDFFYDLSAIIIMCNKFRIDGNFTFWIKLFKKRNFFTIFHFFWVVPVKKNGIGIW